MKKIIFAVMALVLVSAGMAAAEEGGVEIGGDYRFRYDNLSGTTHDYYKFGDVLGFMLGGPAPSLTKGETVKNNSLYLNRFGINLKANAVEDITVKARLVMYKVWGQETMTPVMGNYFADRAMGPNDGTVGHVPSDNAMRVDSAYATWSNVGGAPAWFSVGRRPSTGGIPTNVRQNTEKIGTAGIPAIMVDYAFDGLTIGYAPDIAVMPGAYAKLCYGRGFDSGFKSDANSVKDTDFLGLNAAVYDTEKLHVELQYQKGWHIFNAPSDAGVTTNLGDISWVGGVVTGKIDNLNLFFSAATSNTTPNDNLYMVDTTGDGVPDMGVAGLMYDAAAMGGEKKSQSGNAFYLGGRYDIKSTGTKIGAEYNHGSQYWIGMVPAGDDLWTSKLGTRGSVYELYVIQELKNKPIAKKGQAFFRLGYQMSKYDYTGSNSWIGAPKKIDDLASPANAQMLTPIKDSKDIYLTFDVKF